MEQEEFEKLLIDMIECDKEKRWRAYDLLLAYYKSTASEIAGLKIIISEAAISMQGGNYTNAAETLEGAL